MIPGPANVLSCPHCGGTKEVMGLVSGNTIGATIWSDTRREYPMLPELSPIQQCPHCKKYYFLHMAKSEYSKDPKSEMRSFMRLGKLTYAELKEAKAQMDTPSLDKDDRWMLNRELFMAYNDMYRRGQGEDTGSPTAEDEAYFSKVIQELLEDIRPTKDYELFHAELLRESGRMEEARTILLNHTDVEDEWVKREMLRHIEENDTLPFLLVLNGKEVKQ